MKNNLNENNKIIENIPFALIVVDEKGEILKLNKKAKELFSISKGENLFNIKKNFPPFEDLIKKENKKEISLENNIVLGVTSTPLEKEKHLLIFRDISEEKKLQKIRTDFISFTSHQLKSPLSEMRWALKMLLNEDLGELKEEQKKYIERMYQTSKEMTDLIENLLNIDKMEEGKYFYNFKEEDIIKITQQVISSLRGKAEKKGLKLIFEKPEKEELKVNMDEKKIDICMRNLIENAIKYTEKGEIKVFLKEEEKKVIFSVKDSGEGIPEEKQDSIFTKFFTTKKRDFSKNGFGSGLGLYISKKIIESHKGEIWFQSQKGKGSTFYFSLPL